MTQAPPPAAFVPPAAHRSLVRSPSGSLPRTGGGLLVALGLGAALLAATGCAPGAAATAKAPSPAPPASTGAPERGTPGATESDPLALPDTFRTEAFGADATADVEALPPRPKGVPAAPAKSCAEAQTPPVGPVCGAPELERKALADALANPSAPARNGALLALEACHFPPGLIRALRAELLPIGCADTVLEPYLSSAKTKDTSAEVRGAMVGLVFAAWAYRAVTPAPSLPPPHTKDKVLAHVKGPGLRWVQTQSAALDELGKRAVKLPLYGRGVAAIELGNAYLRFVQGIRELPIPDEFKNDKELEDVYFGSLDQLFEPQKAAGRDAALVGLRDFALLGAIDDARTKRARTLLASVYGGKKATALEALVLVPGAGMSATASTTKAPTAPDAQLARQLPTFYAAQLLPAPAAEASAPLDDELLAALAERGLPQGFRNALQSGAKTSPQGAASVALARARMGRDYARSIDWERSLAAVKEAPSTPQAELLRALGLALHVSPESMSQVVRGALAPLDLRALDAVAKAHPNDELGAAAAFDAALLFQLVPPTPTDAAYFHALAARYRDAAKRGGETAAEAQRGAENAELVAKELEAKK
jgi:hypothetical protein